MQHAILGGGCFWCTEAVFLQLKGVEKVVSGYTGGDTINPTYEQICTGDTNHAEVILIDFDEQQINFKQLLDVFFTTHDATTLNRQGNDLRCGQRATGRCVQTGYRDHQQHGKDQLHGPYTEYGGQR